LVAGEISVDDLPEVWNSECKRLLHIQPQNDADGVLQDVHWSLGALGYFPTYTLGTLYSAQFFAAMQNDLGEIDPLIEKGDFSSIKKWLFEKIHAHGQKYSAEELSRKICGEGLNPEYFMNYLRDKYSALYDFR
jgi:carboxypeptidase Taq